MNRSMFLSIALIIYLFSNSFVFDIRPASIIASQENYLSTFLLIKIIALVISGIISFVLLIQRKGFLAELLSTDAKYLILFFTWALLSTIWAVNKELTIYRSFEFLIGVVLFFLFSKTIKDLDDLAKNLKKILLVIISISLINIIYLAGNLGYDWNSYLYWSEIVRGNTTSMVGGMLAIFGLAHINKNKKSVFVFLFGFMILVLFKSSASLILFIFSVLFVVFNDIKKAIFIGLILAILSFIYLEKIAELILIFDPRKNYEHITTLTGRFILWHNMYDLMKENYLLGYGFANERIILHNLPGTWAASNAHNGYLSSFFGLGLIGFLLTILVIKKTYNKIKNIHRIDNAVGRSLYGIFFLLITNNLTIPGIGAIANTSWFIIFYILLIQNYSNNVE